MATLIKTDGSESELLPKNPPYFTLEELQTAVGGYIQILELPSGQILVMDEEGKLKENPIPNPRATLLGRACGTADDDVVMGDVLVCESHEIE